MLYNVFQVKKIHVPERYKGNVNSYESDIAILQVTTTLTLSVVVQPICLDVGNSLESQQLKPNNLGVVRKAFSFHNFYFYYCVW